MKVTLQKCVSRQANRLLFGILVVEISSLNFAHFRRKKSAREAPVSSR